MSLVVKIEVGNPQYLFFGNERTNEDVGKIFETVKTHHFNSNMYSKNILRKKKAKHKQ